MRITVPVVIEMTDEQVAAYAVAQGIGSTRARDVVADVRTFVLGAIQDSTAFSGGAADVTLKER